MLKQPFIPKKLLFSSVFWHLLLNDITERDLEKYSKLAVVIRNRILCYIYSLTAYQQNHYLNCCDCCGKGGCKLLFFESGSFWMIPKLVFCTFFKTNIKTVKFNSFRDSIGLQQPNDQRKKLLYHKNWK